VIARYADLAGARVLVTGSAAGIGRAVALALAEQGAQVVGIDHQAAAYGSWYEHQTCDLSDADQLAEALARITATPLDGVVNVAGIDPKISLAEADLAAWHRVIDLDLRAYHLVLHHALAALQRGRLKAIVNLSSINHRLGVPRRGLYTVAKCGVIGLTRGLARELGRDGIRINTVSPGWIFTERQVEEYFADNAAGQANRQELFAKQSLALEIQAADVAQHVLFYMSGASRASTGHNCVVDAGWTLE
jgi:NAD(P)-dependent dehydrogenase (short-subunit alcohol dehydrogenase family)